MSCHRRSFSLIVFEDSCSFDVCCCWNGWVVIVGGSWAISPLPLMLSGDEVVVDVAVVDGDETDNDNEGGENEFPVGVDWKVQFVLVSSINRVFS